MPPEQELDFSAELMVLRKAVRDGEPRCLGADEDVRRGTNGWFIAERAKRNMDERAVANQGVEERAAPGTASIVGEFFSEDEQALQAVAEPELLTLDASERLEGTASGAAAVRAVTVERIGEAVLDRELHSAAKALARESATT